MSFKFPLFLLANRSPCSRNKKTHLKTPDANPNPNIQMLKFLTFANNNQRFCNPTNPQTRNLSNPKQTAEQNWQKNHTNNNNWKPKCQNPQQKLNYFFNQSSPINISTYNQPHITRSSCNHKHNKNTTLYKFLSSSSSPFCNHKTKISKTHNKRTSLLSSSHHHHHLTSTNLTKQQDPANSRTDKNHHPRNFFLMHDHHITTPLKLKNQSVKKTLTHPQEKTLTTRSPSSSSPSSLYPL